MTGSLPFPFATSPTSVPTDPRIGFPGTLRSGPHLRPDARRSAAPMTPSPISPRWPTATRIVFSDRILAAANRNITTDFAAPALDIPTFRRIRPRRRPDGRGPRHDRPRLQRRLQRGGYLALGGDRHRVVRPGRLGPRLLGRHLRDGRHGRRLPDPAGRGSHAGLRPEDGEEPLGVQQPRWHQRHPGLDLRPDHRRQRRPERRASRSRCSGARSTANTPGSTSAMPSPPSRARSPSSTSSITAPSTSSTPTTTA